MRLGLIFAPLLLCPAPALAQAAPVPNEVQQVFADPSTSEKLVDVMQTLSKAFLDLRIGEVEAAAQGRKPTDADRRRTIASESKMTERELRTRLDAAKPMLQQGMKAFSEALPSMMEGLAKAQQSLERAAANMPDPNYPKR